MPSDTVRVIGPYKLKMLTAGDDYMRECHAIEAGTSFVSTRVMQALDRLVRKHGAPEYL